MKGILELTVSEQLKQYQAVTEKEIVNVNEFEAWKFDCLWAEVVYRI